jgi:hypothetical protein
VTVRRFGVITLALITLMGAAAAPASAAEPTIGLSASSARPGDTIVVTLAGWPSTTTVTLCGNAAHRGTVDCDQIGGVGLAGSVARVQRRQLQLTTPPSPCPCVIRAATAGDKLVQTVPIDLVGVGTAPVTDPDLNGADAVRIRARVIRGNPGFFDRLRSSLGGPTDRTLELVLTNQGQEPLAGLSLVVAVARQPQGGEPLQPPNVGVLPPGESRTYRLPIALPAPSFGTYSVFGTVYGAGSPVTFSAETKTMPIGLFLIVVLLVVIGMAVLSLRVRRRQERREYVDVGAREFNGQANVS